MNCTRRSLLKAVAAASLWGLAPRALRTIAAPTPPPPALQRVCGTAWGLDSAERRWIEKNPESVEFYRTKIWSVPASIPLILF